MPGAVATNTPTVPVCPRPLPQVEQPSTMNPLTLCHHDLTTPPICVVTSRQMTYTLCEKLTLRTLPCTLPPSYTNQIRPTCSRYSALAPVATTPRRLSSEASPPLTAMMNVIDFLLPFCSSPRPLCPAELVSVEWLPQLPSGETARDCPFNVPYEHSSARCPPGHETLSSS